MARPSKKTKAICDEIVRRLRRGETLRRMCADNPHLPHRDTVDDWADQDAEFSGQIARARQIGSHALIEENRDIADDGSNDYMERFDKDGASLGYFLNGEAVSRSKLRIDQRWREAEAILPKVYGKSTRVEHSGTLTVKMEEASDDELVAYLIELQATGRFKPPAGVMLEEGSDDEDDDDPYGVG